MLQNYWSYEDRMMSSLGQDALAHLQSNFCQWMNSGCNHFFVHIKNFASLGYF